MNNKAMYLLLGELAPIYKNAYWQVLVLFVQ